MNTSDLYKEHNINIDSQWLQSFNNINTSESNKQYNNNNNLFSFTVTTISRLISVGTPNNYVFDFFDFLQSLLSSCVFFPSCTQCFIILVLCGRSETMRPKIGLSTVVVGLTFRLVLRSIHNYFPKS